MKIDVKKLIRDETGQTLIMALILLLLGGLIVAPLLSYMGTGLASGGVYEKKAAELYAADAGVEDAVWKLQHPDEAGYLPCSAGSPPRNYTISDVNGKSVDVTITCHLDDENGRTYGIESIATGDGSGTKIDAYIFGSPVYDDYSGILDNVITSQCDYTLQGGQTQVDPPEGEEHGPEADYDGDWPTGELLAALYWEDVKDETPYGFASLDVKNYYTTGIGPFYRDGTLDIENSGTKDLTLQLNGTVYITGDTQIGQTGQNFYLNLNGNTIFVESDTGSAPEDDPCNPPNDYALKIGGKCTIIGSGCIIAIGGIEFKPGLPGDPDSCLFVMSLRGKTYMQPNGDFYGTLAGSSEVYIQNGEAHWVDSSGIALDFPTILTTGLSYSVASWEVGPPE
jgi:hypothetical protein